MNLSRLFTQRLPLVDSVARSRRKMSYRVGRPLCLVALLFAVALLVLTGASSRRPQPGGPTVDLDAITVPPFCAGPLQVQGVNAFVCEFPVNWVFDADSLAPFAPSSWGVTIQAVR